MSKLQSANPEAVDAANRLHEECRTEEPRDIDVCAMAHMAGAYVVFEPLVNQLAHVVTVEGHRIMAVAEHLRDSVLWRFDLAHEIGHAWMRHPLDELGVCTGEMTRTNGHRWRFERSASDFAVELLMLRKMFQPRMADRPRTVETLRALARTFRMGLRSIALRYAELCPEPCAVVLSVNNRIKWSAENDAFALKIVKGRDLDERTHAAAMHRGENVAPGPAHVPTLGWHVMKRAPNIELWEETIPDVEEPNATLTWLRHEAV